MALYLKKQINEDTTIGIWKIEEDFDTLLSLLFSYGVEDNSHDILSLKNFANEKRKLEWLATRVLTNALMDKNTIIKHDSYGKPHLQSSELSISISHSYDHVTVLLTNKREAGIDIELLSEKIAKIALRFLNIEETEGIEQKNRILHLYLHWCAKETLYKIYGRKELNFIKNLHIYPFTVNKEGSCRGKISINDFIKEYDLHYFTFDDYVVVWGAE